MDLCRIPSVSASGFAPEEVRRSAQAVAQTLRDAGVEHVEVLEIPGVHPYVYGDWLHRPGRGGSDSEETISRRFDDLTIGRDMRTTTRRDGPTVGQEAA